MVGITEISRRLSDRAEDVCKLLLPSGKLERGEWVCGDVSGSPGKTLHVSLEGNHRGKWRDWANDEHRGDLVDLWRFCRGVSIGEAVSQVKDYLGIKDGIVESGKIYAQPSLNGTKLITPEGEAIKYLSETRRLSKETISTFKIEVKPESRAIVFPCYSPSGKLVNRSFRSLPKNGEKKQVWQEKGCAPSLFGWHALPESAIRDRTVLLCEGQIDCMTWHQWGIPALSIPNGSGQTWIEYEWDNLSIFTTIYIAFDMDGPGADNARKAVDRLGKHRCLIVELPGKDANDCLIEGYKANDAQQWVASSRPPKINGLVSATSLKERVILDSSRKPNCFTLPFLKGDTPNSGFYPRPGEVTIWTGVTSHGKTTLLNFFILSFLARKTPVFVASLEAKPERLISKMIRTAVGGPYNEKAVDQFMKEYAPNLFFADVLGYIEQGLLLEMMKFCFQRHGVQQVFIDSLMRIQGLEEDYPAQGDFMNKLQEFAKGTDAHVHVVAHPKKGGMDQVPGKLDIKGSSLIPNNADNIITVSKNLDKEKKRRENKLTPDDEKTHDAEIWIEKQRETGWEGRILLKFNPETYVFSKYK